MQCVKNNVFFKLISCAPTYIRSQGYIIIIIIISITGNIIINIRARNTLSEEVIREIKRQRKTLEVVSILQTSFGS